MVPVAGPTGEGRIEREVVTGPTEKPLDGDEAGMIGDTTTGV